MAAPKTNQRVTRDRATPASTVAWRVQRARSADWSRSSSASPKAAAPTMLRGASVSQRASAYSTRKAQAAAVTGHRQPATIPPAASSSPITPTTATPCTGAMTSGPKNRTTAKSAGARRIIRRRPDGTGAVPARPGPARAAREGATRRRGGPAAAARRAWRGARDARAGRRDRSVGDGRTRGSRHLHRRDDQHHEVEAARRQVEGGLGEARIEERA